MSNEKKKQYLRRYLVAKRCAALLLEQIESLRENKMSPSGTLDGMPHGSGTSDLSGYAARLDELMRELEAEREMLMVTYHEIWNQVKKISNATEQEVLTRRYLIGQSWEKIAVEMHYSYRQIIRIHGAALQHFSW